MIRRRGRGIVAFIRRDIYRANQFRGRAKLVRENLAWLGSWYTLCLSVISFYAGFWIAISVYYELTIRKSGSITIFPQGLTDTTTLIPLTLLAFSGLLFAAQQSIDSNKILRGLYGYSARSLMNAFYFTALSLVLGTAERIVSPKMFDHVNFFGYILRQLTVMMPAAMSLTGLIAGFFVLCGLWAFSRAFAHHAK